MAPEQHDLDLDVRRYIYDVTIRRGDPPTVDEISSTLHRAARDVNEAMERLAAGRVLVLQPDGEILMANPFSAVPTPFVVKTTRASYYANCIWDAFGIPAMLHEDAAIHTACGCCGFATELTAAGGQLDGAGIVHFALPASQWWNDIVFT